MDKENIKHPLAELRNIKKKRVVIPNEERRGI